MANTAVQDLTDRLERLLASTGPLSVEAIVAAWNRRSTGASIPAALVLRLLQQAPDRFSPDGSAWTLANQRLQTDAKQEPLRDEVSPLTPFESWQHVKESLVAYLETAYKLTHPALAAERAEILRRTGTVAQEPFIESTPAFPTARLLRELELEAPETVPPGLSDLVSHGVRVDQYPLYSHQEEALLAGSGIAPNLLVATGTGSGKTESFLLPILADLVREAQGWEEPRGSVGQGQFVRGQQKAEWRPGRINETRPAALRAIVLYPMNALVNDQLSRLRRILALKGSPEWQRQNFNGNTIHFGMYTSMAKCAGEWTNANKRQEWDKYIADVRADWSALTPDLRETGGWADPDSPEMLARWDMQVSPPDILVTNYSMLEYMLVRPIETRIFSETRRWLEEDEGHRVTLVLDEAHTYTGAKGAEVAHLVRRLQERLGLAPGTRQFRAIATSASIPEGADERLRDFVANLFGEASETFSLIRTVGVAKNLKPRGPGDTAHRDAYSRFHRDLGAGDLDAAARTLVKSLGRDWDPIAPISVNLHAALHDDPDLRWVRDRTARNATLLSELGSETWPGSVTAAEADAAVAGLLAAGSLARAMDTPDAPPLLSTRVHAFFRGTAGLWACLDPGCSVAPEFEGEVPYPRPIGKIYTEPRSWCECGSRVLEMFSCRKCGLVFAGGIPDGQYGSLWPWTAQLEGEQADRTDFSKYLIFGVEQPQPGTEPAHRSTRTTLEVEPADPFARDVWEVTPASTDPSKPNPFPTQCPRCREYRAFTDLGDGREIVEDLRTKGPRSFSIVVEDGYRVQPRAHRAIAPNFGRKALLFSDSRQDAAKLAADIRRDHLNDLTRQLAYRALWECGACRGSGLVPATSGRCLECGGSGIQADPSPLAYSDLRSRVIELQIEREINPTGDRMPDFFEYLEQGDARCMRDAELFFDLAMRRELAEPRIALEPLGLARWRLAIRAEDIPRSKHVDEQTFAKFLDVVSRILASERVLLPPERGGVIPSWPAELVKEYDRNLVYKGPSKSGWFVPYNTSEYRRFGRYLTSLTRKWVAAGKISPAAERTWKESLATEIWDALIDLGVLVERDVVRAQQNKPAYGIPIDRFVLHPPGPRTLRCNACGYVMTQGISNVCARCGQDAAPISEHDIDDYYRRSAIHALPGSRFDDPHPLKTIEHTAQIEGVEARDFERWFRNLYRSGENAADKRIDILSVTTTMEMGIDIGDLLSVGLRNVPPTVANYQQRAGRAGRRGSGVATVLTYAQNRSHDQYYFRNPPEIVTDPPRIPELFLANEVIARRHCRSVVLQSFFSSAPGTPGGSTGLFGNWGTVGGAITNAVVDRLAMFIKARQASLLERSSWIVSPELQRHVPEWLAALPFEVKDQLDLHLAKEDLFRVLIDSGLLPGYAYPVDVATLNVPRSDSGTVGDPKSGAMQRDLLVALSEYAPGAQVIRGRGHQTRIYTVAGLFDPMSVDPDYRPTGRLFECKTCLATELLKEDDPERYECQVCGSDDISVQAWLQPKGFTVDFTVNRGEGDLYDGDGRDRAGSLSPIRMLAGPSAFAAGGPVAGFDGRLHAHTLVGSMFACNRGPDARDPGFTICPDCGRLLDDEAGPHLYPANQPPLSGHRQGPRAGTACPNRNGALGLNKVILGHQFHSQVVLLDIQLPNELDAPFGTPAGRALWYSLGTLLTNAASTVLQIDPSELAVGVRPIKLDGAGVTGEVFIYDNVPGGAGYATAIREHLMEIVDKAIELGESCSNPDCPGACYQCVLDYRNQPIHPLLDRGLGLAMLRYARYGEMPVLTPDECHEAGEALVEYAQSSWEIGDPIDPDDLHLQVTLTRSLSDTRVALWIIHPLAAKPSDGERSAFLHRTGYRPAVHNSFDLTRRPFWVVNNLL